MGVAAKATAALPLLPNLLHPDRWLLWLGVLFVLSVYFFPTGIVGSCATKNNLILRRPRSGRLDARSREATARLVPTLRDAVLRTALQGEVL